MKRLLLLSALLATSTACSLRVRPRSAPIAAVIGSSALWPVPAP